MCKGFQMNFTRKSQCDDIRAFSFKSDQIQVSSNSWGPSDNGYTVDGPTKMTQHALKTGVTKVCVAIIYFCCYNIQ